jgi:YD repeat-containing protein
VYNNLNQLETVTGPGGTTWFGFDHAGNRIWRQNIEESETHNYDYENRLISHTKTDGIGVQTWAFAYDYRTRRILRNETDAGGASTSFVFSGGVSVFQRENGATTVECIRGSDMVAAQFLFCKS